VKRFRVLFLLIGFLLLGVLVYQTGLGSILSYLNQIGWRFLLIAGVALCWQVGNTVAWGLAFQGGETALRFRHLFIAKLVGDAVNYITPLLGVGGEFLKPYLIRRHVSLPAGFASIVITKTVQLLTGVIYALVGVGLALFFFRLPPSAWMTIAGVLGAGGVALLWLFVQQQRNPFSSLLDALVRAGIKAAPEGRRHGAAEMDAHLATYYRQERTRLSASVAIYCMSWVFGVVETWLIVHLLGASISFKTAFFLTSLSSVINTFFFFVPGGIGVLEGGQAFLFSLLGLPMGLGVTVGLVKRIRKIFYVLAGLLLVSGRLIRREDGSLEAEAIGMG